MALASDGRLVALRESHDSSYAHSEKLTLYVQQVLNEAGVEAKELDAVCVAKGPGSYTGLRIGVSAAKGLCYGVGVPLLSVDTLRSLALWTLECISSEERNRLHIIRPMIDARRMEVYTAGFDRQGEPLTPISATVVDAGGFSNELSLGPVLFVGDGAEKCQAVLTHPNALFHTDLLPSARGMFQIAEKMLSAGMTEDVAYFEPYYLKDFVAGRPAGQ